MKTIYIAILCFLTIVANAGTIIVTNTNNDGPNSLRQAVIDANANDTIRFAPSLISGGSATILLVGEIQFSKPLVFKGLYNNTDTLYISGGNTNRHLSVALVNTITIDSLVLINGNASRGGAITLNEVDTLYLSNSIIRDNISGNHSIGGIGGAIYSYSNNASSSIFVIKSIITNNKAFSSVSSANQEGNGGGIFSYSFFASPSISIINSIISNNQAEYSGGGVQVSSTRAPCYLSVKNSIINNNSAFDVGGGICAASSISSSVSIINSNISNNKAGFSALSAYEDASGGGIFASGINSSLISVLNSTVSNNTARKSGGGIYSTSYSSYNSASSSKVSVINSTVSNNTAAGASGGGGGIYSDSYSYSGPALSSISIIKSTVSDNNAFYSNGLGVGGIGIFSSSNSAISSSSCDVKISNSTIYNNTSTSQTSLISLNININSPSHTSILEVTSSIIWFNGSRNSTIPITSHGNNIFSNTESGAITSDFVNVTNSALNLLPFAFNGGDTKTLLPGIGSVAIDAGTPVDLSDAQNRPIVGVRDIGAAESCYKLKSEILTKCVNFLWRDGNSYTSDTSNVYYIVKGVAANACDSVYVLNLTISHPSTGDTTAIACGSFSWYGTNYTTSATPSHLFTNGNATGCDSTITLHLTINQPSTGDTTAIACGSFSWYGTNYTTSATPTHVFTNSIGAGCDSTVTLNLTITTIETNVTQIGSTLISSTPGASYQWLDCNKGNTPISGATNQSYTATANGKYAVEVTKNGCSAVSICSNISTVDVNSLSSTTFNMYPNPIINELSIKNQGEINQIEVIDMTGKILQTVETNASSTIKLDFSTYKVGLYMIKIYTNTGQVSISRVLKN